MPRSESLLVVVLALWVDSQFCWKRTSTFLQSLSAGRNIKCCEIPSTSLHPPVDAVLNLDMMKHSKPTVAENTEAQILTESVQTNWTLGRLDSAPLRCRQTLGLDFKMKCSGYFHLKRRTLEQWFCSLSAQPK